MSTKVRVREEVKPHPKPEGNNNQLYNSPPSFEGRYFLLNQSEHPIERATYGVLKENHWIWYWGSEHLEDFDMFNDDVGYRLSSEGLAYLKRTGYEVEIFTLEQQKEAARIAQEKEEQRALEKKAEKEKQEAEYKQRTEEIEKMLTAKKITFHGQGMVKKFKDTDYMKDNTKKITISKNSDSYTQYTLTLDDRIFRFNKYFFDMWDSDCSNQKAPKEFLELLEQQQQR